MEQTNGNPFSISIVVASKDDKWKENDISLPKREEFKSTETGKKTVGCEGTIYFPSDKLNENWHILLLKT